MTTTEPVRCTFVDGTEARDLNVGRLGLCGPEAMQRAIERQEGGSETAEDDEALYERLAAMQHDIWSHWMKYLLTTKATPSALEGDDAVWLAGADVKHWWRQIETPYAELSEREKGSDREQVERYWNLVSTDRKSRGPEFRRGFADGRNAERAGAPDA